MVRPEASQSASGASERNDLALLEGVRRGDRRAFADLYRLYHPRLYGYLSRILQDPCMVEEVLDDVMFVVWKDAGRFRGTAAVSSWIFGIAYRKAMTAIRAEGRYQAPLDRAADASALPGGSSGNPELIRAALMRLSPDHRQVVELTYFSGFSYREIAVIAECPVNTVKTRMYHAKRRLRVLLPLLAGEAKERDRERA